MTATRKPAASDFARASRAAKFIQSRTKLRPRIGLVLGSGLGAFADELSSATRIPYHKIPGFPRSTVEGHAGQLVIGKLGDLPVAVMQGRVHLYEGYAPTGSRVSDARPRAAGNSRGDPDERRGRDQRGL